MLSAMKEVIPVGESPQWYKDAILYELHVKAFQDADGDGIGDFRGPTERPDYLQELGWTAIAPVPGSPGGDCLTGRPAASASEARGRRDQPRRAYAASPSERSSRAVSPRFSGDSRRLCRGHAKLSRGGVPEDRCLVPWRIRYPSHRAWHSRCFPNGRGAAGFRRT
jgi:hypothetical protein